VVNIWFLITLLEDGDPLNSIIEIAKEVNPTTILCLNPSGLSDVNDIGQPIHRPEELVHDGKYTMQSLDGQYQISLKIPDTIVAQNDMDIAFSISDISGIPIINLEPIIAAGVVALLSVTTSKAFCTYILLKKLLFL
jgi:hypothetical protein